MKKGRKKGQLVKGKRMRGGYRRTYKSKGANGRRREETADVEEVNCLKKGRRNRYWGITRGDKW